MYLNLSWFIPDMVAAFPVGYILLIAVICFFYNPLTVLKLHHFNWKTCVLCPFHDRIYNTMVTLPHPEPAKWCASWCLWESSVLSACCVCQG